MCAAIMLYLAFKDINPSYSIQVPFRYDGDLFDLRRLKSKTKAFAKHIRGVQYFFACIPHITIANPVFLTQNRWPDWSEVNRVFAQIFMIRHEVE